MNEIKAMLKRVIALEMYNAYQLEIIKKTLNSQVVVDYQDVYHKQIMPLLQKLEHDLAGHELD